MRKNFTQLYVYEMITTKDGLYIRIEGRNICIARILRKIIVLM